MTFPPSTSISLNQRIEAVFKASIPLASHVAHTRAVGWWWCRGAILRLEIVDGVLDLEIVDPDTDGMDELLKVAGVDALIDAHLVQPYIGPTV